MWLKKQIKESEDELTPLQDQFRSWLGNPLEARDLFFRTTELELEFETG